jgi:hypothetical protein
MSVSIVIPLYNKAPYVRRALASILTQTWQDFEVIVVDDGSTDGGADIVARCADRRVRLICQPNAGPGAARNRGLREARYELVAFLDADDEWLPEYLARSVGFLSSHSDVVSISMAYSDAGRNPDAVNAGWTARGIATGVYAAGAAGFSARLAATLLSYITPCSTVFRRPVLLRYGGFFDQYKCVYGEDHHLWIQLLLNERVGLSREPLVIIHTEASQLSQNRYAPFPMLPFLLTPDVLYRSCPDERRELLEELLAIRAVGASIDRALNGCGREARWLLARHCQKYHPAQYGLAKVYSLTAALLPLLRACRRTARRILRLP